eukprot:scaffold310544_cov18-Tisochrysis_lutea.AAC.1
MPQPPHPPGAGGGAPTHVSHPPHPPQVPHAGMPPAAGGLPPGISHPASAAAGGGGGGAGGGGATQGGVSGVAHAHPTMVGPHAVRGPSSQLQPQQQQQFVQQGVASGAPGPIALAAAPAPGESLQKREERKKEDRLCEAKRLHALRKGTELAGPDAGQ